MPRPHHTTPSRSGSSFAPRLSSTPQAPRTGLKKIRVIKSEMRPVRPVKREQSPPHALELDDYGMGMDYDEGPGNVEVVDAKKESVGTEDVMVVSEEMEEDKEDTMTVDV